MCTLCNTQLLTVGAVKKHIKNDHFGFTPFQCPACKKMIQQKNHLKAHIGKAIIQFKNLSLEGTHLHISCFSVFPTPLVPSLKGYLQG